MKKNLDLDLYKKMFLIRTAEEKIRAYYPKDEIKSPTHLAIGEEAIAAGVITATSPNNQIFGTYRNHGIYLAKTGETDKFFAELFGKETGLAKGKSGSMHIMAPNDDFSGTSAIVASTIPVAVGAAYSNKIKKNGKITVVFFGDGAIDEGVFWESVNFACLKKLPIIFVCEDNDLAIHSFAHHRHGYKSISSIISKFDCHTFSSKTTDVEKIYDLIKKALKLQSVSGKPVFMHLKYYRYLEHVGVNQDFNFGYRSEEEYKKWYNIDPVNSQRKRLLKRGYTQKELTEIEKVIIEKIKKSINKALQDPLPKVHELLTDIYYE